MITKKQLEQQKISKEKSDKIKEVLNKNLQTKTLMTIQEMLRKKFHEQNEQKMMEKITKKHEDEKSTHQCAK